MFVLVHGVAFALTLATCFAAGTAISGTRFAPALRSTIGLAVLGQVLLVLALCGWLRALPILILITVSCSAALLRGLQVKIDASTALVLTFVAVPVFLLALYPPSNFDETLYHLPFVRALSTTGSIDFLPHLRFPIFPQLHEVLCVPLFVFVGDTATHLVAAVELLLLVMLLIEHAPRRSSGRVAVALLVGSPIVLQLATITYVDTALMLLVTSGVLAARRVIEEESSEWIAVSALLLGSACSVKYLGLYFVVAALVMLAVPSERRANAMVFGILSVVAAMPMYLRIFVLTGNPLFPFLGRFFGDSAWSVPLGVETPSMTRALRLLWDVTFARDRVGQQPPLSPLFAVAVVLLIIDGARAVRRGDRHTTAFAAMVLTYLLVFVTVLHADSRYLLPLLPLLMLHLAERLREHRRLLVALAIISASSFIGYTALRLWRQGLPPTSAAAREQYLRRKVPELVALEHRSAGPVYICGGEQLMYYAGDAAVGDVYGPNAESVVLGRSRDSAALSAALSVRGIDQLLVSHRACPEEWRRLAAPPHFQRVFGDEGATLWRRSDLHR